MAKKNEISLSYKSKDGKVVRTGDMVVSMYRYRYNHHYAKRDGNKTSVAFGLVESIVKRRGRWRVIVQMFDNHQNNLYAASFFDHFIMPDELDAFKATLPTPEE